MTNQMFEYKIFPFKSDMYAVNVTFERENFTLFHYRIILGTIYG